jgi:2,3-bisphosphoglycerate-dependent phosphoglycerate mutase
MQTILYLVRHAESVYTEGEERTRGLSAQGIRDAGTVQAVLKSENIDMFISSPYKRAVETIRPAAQVFHKDIELEEDLRERSIGDFADVIFKEAKRRVFEETDFAFPNGESSVNAQKRAVDVILRIIDTHTGKSIAVGTHGDIMTLMLHYFNKQYGYLFWESTSMPDIYKVRFDGHRLMDVTRMWEPITEKVL